MSLVRRAAAVIVPAATPLLAALVLAGPADAVKASSQWCKPRSCTTSDKAAPSVTITAPAANAKVKGLVTVSGTASDAVGVTKVEVMVDLEPWQLASGTTSWSSTVDTTSLQEDAQHVFAVRATDAAGNVRTTSIAVTVDNVADTTAPTVAITAPTQSSTVSGSVTATGSASDASGVSTVEVRVDSGTWQAASGTTSWSKAIDTTSLSDGAHTISLRATDSAGNAGTASVGVTVANPTAPAPSTSRIYWGAYINGRDTYNFYYSGERTWQDAPWDYTTWDRFEQNAGKKVGLESFGLKNPMTGVTLDTVALDRVRARGALPVLNIHTSYGSTDPTNAAVAAGNYDTQWRAWFTSVKNWGHPMFLVLDPEMNGPWSPYAPGVNGNTAASFVAMWRHLHDLATSVGAGNITWVWCPNVDAANRFTPFEQLYPGDAYVDWTGLDGYNQGNQTWDAIFKTSYDRLVTMAPTKPIMISQTGSVDPAGTTQKADWIRDSLSTKIPGYYNKIEALVWFNWRIWENSAWQEWPIESSASATTAFRNAISSPYYAPGGSFTPPAAGTKIKPL